MKVSVIGSSLALVSGFASQAFAFVEDVTSSIPQSNAFNQGQESAWSLPAPGQALIRTATRAPKQESSFSVLATDVRTEVDSIGGDLRLVSGTLGLDLQTVFGKGLGAWQTAAQKSSKSKAEMGQHLSKVLLKYVADHKADLKLDASQLRWNANKFYSDASSTLATFDVVVNGAKVQGSSVSFRFSQSKLNQIALRTFGAMGSAEAKSAGLLASKSQFDAQKSLSRILGPSSSLNQKGEGVIFVRPSASGKGYDFVPAWNFEGKSASGEPFSITQSLTSQEVLEWFSQRYKYEGQIEGRVNVRIPGEEQTTVALPFLKVTKRTGGWFGRTRTFVGDADGFLKVPGSDSVTLGLQSKFFDISNSGGSAASVVATGDALFDEKNSTLAEVNALHHAEVVRQFTSSFIKDAWFDASVKINVNIQDACNAYWDGSTLNFFQAGSKKGRTGKINDCNNTAEIADVVYHEYGHGIDANTGGIEDGAYSEGIGDITSMLITGSPKVGPGFFKDGGEVRNMEGEYQYPPKADEKEVHKQGLIIGSTWYHLTESLKNKYGEKDGQRRAAGMFFKSLFTTSQYTDSYDATLSLNAEGGTAESAPDFCLINKAFARHGLAKAEARCS